MKVLRSKKHAKIERGMLESGHLQTSSKKQSIALSPKHETMGRHQDGKAASKLGNIYEDGNDAVRDLKVGVVRDPIQVPVGPGTRARAKKG
ncbi:hypothetical protein AAHA92_23339 [Salvia divinorum]|uniref:Uncharacterized protein n=1 Tax=Salvia divinorum TaxID=28513 RepID=A0ABD1GRL9_SALDI